MLFDRICWNDGITHWLTEPASPTTTGKIEPFDTLLAAQAAIDTWVTGDNCDRPHQALDMATRRPAQWPGHVPTA